MNNCLGYPKYVEGGKLQAEVNVLGKGKRVQTGEARNLGATRSSTLVNQHRAYPESFSAVPDNDVLSYTAMEMLQA